MLTASQAPPTRDRLLALDVVRGMTVAGMLLVNDPGSWGHIYPPLAHAAWHGWTPTDLIFPFFLFIVGITTYLSLASRRARGDRDAALVRQILRRGTLLILAGLLLNWFPFVSWGPTVPDAGRFVDRLYHLRIPGVLQRIGAAYLVSGLLTLRTSRRTQILIVTTILAVYWFVLVQAPIDLPAETIDARIDRLLLDWGPYGNHLWADSRTWDPEGLLSTLPAVATVMLGTIMAPSLVSERPLADRINSLFVAGTVLMVGGWAWSGILPINKNLWTSSYVLFSAGLAAMAIAFCTWVVDLRGSRWWTRPFVIFGVNPFVAFIGSGVLARLIYSVITVPDGSGGRQSLEQAIYLGGFASWLPPRLGSLAFAMSFVLLWLGVLTMLHRRHLILKI